MAERIVFFKTSRASFATTRNSSNLGGHPKVPVRTTSGERCGLNTGEAISVRASTHAPLDVLLQAAERDRVNRNHTHIGRSGALPQRTHRRRRFEPPAVAEPQDAVGGVLHHP